jgi:Na+/H+-dicarboxylate symporter
MDILRADCGNYRRNFTGIFYTSDPELTKSYINIAKFGNIIFLRFIKLIIGPLVLSTLVVGVAGIGDAGTVGRMGVKTIGWFILASLMSLTLGLIIVNIFKPGLDFPKSNF